MKKYKIHVKQLAKPTVSLQQRTADRKTQCAVRPNKGTAAKRRALPELPQTQQQREEHFQRCHKHSSKEKSISRATTNTAAKTSASPELPQTQQQTQQYHQSCHKHSSKEKSITRATTAVHPAEGPLYSVAALLTGSAFSTDSATNGMSVCKQHPCTNDINCEAITNNKQLGVEL